MVTLITALQIQGNKTVVLPFKNRIKKENQNRKNQLKNEY